jgi:hypothetical protein
MSARANYPVGVVAFYSVASFGIGLMLGMILTLVVVLNWS